MEDIILANEELNKWCGTEGINYYEGIEALGFLFLHAVPKVEVDNQCTIFLRLCTGEGWTKRGWMCSVSDTTPFEKIGVSPEGLSDPTSALFWAVDGVRRASNG